MKKASIFSAVITAVVLSTATISGVHASDVKYNYIEGRYALDAEVEGAPGDGDGLQIGGSFRINSDLYVFGRYDALDLDFNNDVDIFKIGIGYIHPLNQMWDANFALALVNAEVNNNDDDGFSLSAGVRGMMMPKLEGRAAVTYIDVSEDDTFITLGADYFIQDNLSVGLELDLAGDVETTSLGVRFYY